MTSGSFIIESTNGVSLLKILIAIFHNSIVFNFDSYYLCVTALSISQDALALVVGSFEYSKSTCNTVPSNRNASSGYGELCLQHIQSLLALLVHKLFMPERIHLKMMEAVLEALFLRKAER